MSDQILHFRRFGAPSIPIQRAHFCGDCDALFEGPASSCPNCSGLAVWSLLELLAQGVQKIRQRRNRKKEVVAPIESSTARTSHDKQGAARTGPPSPLHELEGRGGER